MYCNFFHFIIFILRASKNIKGNTSFYECFDVHPGPCKKGITQPHKQGLNPFVCPTCFLNKNTVP